MWCAPSFLLHNGSQRQNVEPLNGHRLSPASPVHFALTCCCDEARQASSHGYGLCTGKLLLDRGRQLLQVMLCEVAEGVAEQAVHTKACIGASMDEAKQEYPGTLGAPAGWVGFAWGTAVKFIKPQCVVMMTRGPR